MKILYAASEANPFAASGGLGDVAGSLPVALQKLDAECRLVLPLYGTTHEKWKSKMQFIASFSVPLGWRQQYAGLFQLEHNGVTVYFIDNEYYFKREKLYGFFDDGERFAFFSKAVLEALPFMKYSVDVIHCNDWQTALIPVFLNAFYRDIPLYHKLHTVFTIHNIAYQGQYDMFVASDVCGLPPQWEASVEYQGDCNYMKGALEQCEWITTVSPSYAKEIMDPYFSFGLDPVLRDKAWKCSGILNGIDTVLYNPEKDPLITSQYSASAPEGKESCKIELQRKMNLPQNADIPIIAIISRLVSQKGIDLMIHKLEQLLQKDVQIVVLGNGAMEYEAFFFRMASVYPDKLSFHKGFNPELSHVIYAGADLFLMPSKTEPCGLAQMIALRYGTIPIVHSTGGLKDSITDWDSADGGNGFTFQSYNADDMYGAVLRALGLYENKPCWNKAVINALQQDFTWEKSAEKYLECYLKI